WLAQHDAVVTFTHFYASDALPDVQDIDMVIALGGPMSVNDESTLPWLRKEKQFIRDAIENDKMVLGICLGAQLIANALGATVQPNRHKEIGWFPVFSLPTTSETVFRFPSSVDVFHWHGETFDLPPAAIPLACSVACQNQGFQLGTRVIGLQFHLETTEETARLFVETDNGEELVDGPYIQTAQQILDAPPASYARINALMAEVLDYLNS
ncbi:MAG TPA: type 1 glutamine amidotransferase, partial [Pseudomonadales bacterium]|nr:type 1 glutamine amidotransferase [Pseudomonadales bacterium]